MSDDPEVYVNPVDLFEEQVKGLHDDYGKKEKRTTLQAIFFCKICDTEVKSIKTLR